MTGLTTRPSETREGASRGPRPTAAGPALVGVGALAAATAILHATDALLDGPDPFWHWDAGRRMITSMMLLDSDPYSFLTEGREWVLNQWGAEALFGLADVVGGLWLVGVLAALLAGTVVFVTGMTAWRLAPSLAIIPLLGLVVMTFRYHWGLRGHLFTLILLPLVLREFQREKPRSWRVVLLFALWANLHGAVLLGLVVAGVAALGRWAKTAPGERCDTAWRCGRPVLAGFLGACLTPYGPPFLWHAVTTGRSAVTTGITEWGPASPAETRVLPLTLLVIVILGSTAVAASREDAGDVLLVVFFALLGFSAFRNTATAAVGLVVVGAPYVAETIDQFRFRVPRGASRPSRLDHVLAIALALVALPVSAALVPASSDLSAHVDDLPLEAAERLASTNRSVRLFTTSAWAPGLGILGGDHVRTATDGRVELFTMDEYEVSQSILSADPGWQASLDDWCVTDIIVPTDSPLADVLPERAEYEQLGVYAVADTDDADPAAWYRRASDDCTP